MSTADPPPDRLALELRRRAQAMRVLGQWPDRSPATMLALRAGPEVWSGPAARQCSGEPVARHRRRPQHCARGRGPR